LRWYYDAERGTCRQFVYGGCKGNANKFRTLAACQQRCPSQGILITAAEKEISLFHGDMGHMSWDATHDVITIHTLAFTQFTFRKHAFTSRIIYFTSRMILIIPRVKRIFTPGNETNSISRFF
jgi:hypothetical protein